MSPSALSQQIRSTQPVHEPSQPSCRLLDLQAKWLASARSRMLRRSSVARCTDVLDLGAGYGSTTAELAQRTRGSVTALDSSWKSLYEFDFSLSILRVVGDSGRLPVMDGHFDMVFCQVGFLWMKPLESVAAEIWRVLGDEGVLISIEPDFQSLIEYPPEIATKDIWISALRRAGANIEACRKAPSILEALGFKVRVDLLDRVHPPSPSRFEFLRELHLSDDEGRRLDVCEARSKEAGGWSQLVHLPFMLTTAEKR